MAKPFRLGRAVRGPIVVERNLAYVHTWVLGRSGGGKTGFFNHYILTTLLEHPDVDLTVIDPKSDAIPALRDFLLALDGEIPGVSADSILSISAFGDYAVPLGLLARDPNVDAAVHAYNCAALVAGMTDGAGPRMAHVLQGVFTAIWHREGGGGLVDAPRLLADELYRQHYASRVTDRASRRYLLEGLPSEPLASRQACLARLDNLLVVPSIRAALGGHTSIPVGDLVDGPRLVLVDLSGAPQGLQAAADLYGQSLFARFTGAVFARKSKRHRVLCCDEWPVLASRNPADFEKVASLARSRNVSMVLANQTRAQIQAVSSVLSASIAENAARTMSFAPDESELRSLIARMPISGRRLNPARPDVRLTRAEEEAEILSSLRALPQRHCVVVDDLRPEDPVYTMRVMNLPYEEAARRAAAKPPELRDAYLRGSSGMPTGELLREVDAHSEVAPPPSPTRPTPDVPSEGDAGPSERAAAPEPMLPAAGPGRARRKKPTFRMPE